MVLLYSIIVFEYIFSETEKKNGSNSVNVTPKRARGTNYSFGGRFRPRENVKKYVQAIGEREVGKPKRKPMLNEVRFIIF